MFHLGNTLNKVKKIMTYSAGLFIVIIEAYYIVTANMIETKLIQVGGIAVVVLTLSLYQLKKISVETAYAILIYSVFTNMFIGIRYYFDSNYQEAFLINLIYIFIMLPLIGLLVKKVHTIILALGFNVYFLIYILSIKNQFLLDNYIINFFLVTAYGLMLYKIIGMIEKAQEAEEKMAYEIKDKNKKLQTQTQELTEVNKVVSDQNNKMKQMNATKDKLFSIMAHDISNPLNAILGLSEIMKIKNHQGDVKNNQMYAEKIFLASSELSNMMNRLLSWSRTQLGSLNPKTQLVSLFEIYEYELKNMSYQFKNKKLSYHLFHSKDYKCCVDANMLSIIFRNLMSNAIKFSHEKGEIRIEIDKQGNYIRTQIIDNGVGMETEVIKKVSDPYDFYSSRGTKNENGHGLGVNIVFEMIRQNKGSISIDSNPGKGTNFTYLLPINFEFKN